MRFLLPLIIWVASTLLAYADGVTYPPGYYIHPLIGDTTPTHSALVFSTDNGQMINRGFRYAGSTDACAAWGAASNQCAAATTAFLGTLSDAQIQFTRNPWIYAARAAQYGGPLANTAANIAAVAAVTSGSLSFSTSYATYAVTGCDLSSVTTLQGTTATSLASVLQMCINGAAPQLATITGGVLTAKTCVPVGYSGGAWVVITDKGTCPKIYVGMSSGSGGSLTFITQQISGSDGLPCPSTNCNGLAGVYNTFTGTGTQNSWFAPGNLATSAYSVLSYSSNTGVLGVGDFWLQGVGLTSSTTAIASANPTSLTDLAVSPDTSGCTHTCYITNYTGTTIGSESMTASAGYIDVLTKFPTGVPRVYISRDGNFNPDAPVLSAITLPTSGADGLATILNLTAVTGGYASTPAVYATIDIGCAWLSNYLSNVANDFVYVYNDNTIGSNFPPGYNGQPGQSKALATCAAPYGARVQWQPWNGITNQILAPVSPPMFSPFIAGGGLASFPLTSGNKFGPLSAGATFGVGTFAASPAQPLGMDAIFWNMSAFWSTDPVAGGFAVGLDVANSDINIPVEKMPTSLMVAGSGGFPKTVNQDWGTGPSAAVNQNDQLAIAYEPYNSPSAAPTTSAPLISGILQSADCTCASMWGESTTVLNKVGTTQYIAIYAGGSPSTTESIMSAVMPAGATIEAITVIMNTAVVGAGGNYALQLRKNGSNVSGWSGNIGASGTGSAPTTTWTLCAISTHDCTASAPPALTVSQYDTLSLQAISSGTITTAPFATVAIMYAPTDGRSSFLFGRSVSTALPDNTGNRYYSGVGLSSVSSTETPFLMMPNLAAFTPTHPSAFVLSISNLTAAYVSATAQTNRTVAFRKWTAPTYASGANATTPANCTMAAGTIGPVGGGGTAAYICTNATDTWTPASLDQFDLVTAGGSGTTGTAFMWSATAVLQ